ncbi:MULTISPECIES: GGDEF domain-containing phosphodiesterase [unclassified Thioalkalivibrio]|uniref:sensor domain-containing protein n=1 Tax=unclassified Thioalkalivibrio TaxID=2621013 RepID=UPI00036E9628|nr:MULTISPECIES: GGDEF domain-containing phosphodiesterase [unclassified Thioalkalivibrio]
MIPAGLSSFYVCPLSALIAGLLSAALTVIAFRLVRLRRRKTPEETTQSKLEEFRRAVSAALVPIGAQAEKSGLATTLRRMLYSPDETTARLHAQSELLQHLHDLLEKSEDLCGIADADYRYVWVNRAYREHYGLNDTELAGRSLPEVLGADYFEQTVKPHLDRCLGGEAVRYETERTSADGQRHRLRVNYYPLGLPDGQKQRAGAVITDVTDLHTAEAELQRQAHLIEMAGRITRVGGWSVDLDDGRIAWSPVVAEIHALPHGYSPPLEEGINFYAPESRDRIRALFNDCVERGIPYDDELALIDAEGQRKWVRALGEPIRDPDGRIVGAQGAFQDLTQHRERERLLHRFRHIIEQSPAAVAVTDLQGRIEYVNPAFERISGYSSEELEGQTSARIRSGNTPDDIYRDLWATITEGETWTGEIQNRRKDGTLFWEQEVISPLKDEQGQIINYVAIKQDITSLKKAQEQLRRIAYEDVLTGLLSRPGFARALQQRIDGGHWHPAGLLVNTDINALRDINEAYGYQTGDWLLTEFGRRLEAQAGERGLAGRLGGDEFTLFMPEPREPLELALSELHDALTAPFAIQGTDFEVSIRVGYTRMGTQQRTAEDLLHEAELAQFRNRAESSEPWSAFTTRLLEETQQRIDLTRELRQALNEDQLELHFQPKVDLASGQLVGCEALLRWNHPERGLLPPDLFIAVAEQSQLITAVGDWALARACRHLREWRGAGLAPVRVSVNVSLTQFQVGNFARRVRKILDESGVAPEELALEITEGVFIHQSAALRQQIRTLHEMGVRLSLDDFGTGYSSLLYLKQYPFDEIKIDKGFVFHLLDEPFNRSIVETVASLARAIDADIVAEGVESAAVAEALLEMGCPFGQGYYYSMPLEAEDFRWLLERRSRLPLARSNPPPA